MMPEISFSVKLRTGELFRFTLRHTYRSVSGVVSFLFSLVCLVFGLVTIGRYTAGTTLLFIIIGLLFTVIQPCVLYLRCMRQVKKSEQISGTLTYTLTDEGIIIRQEEQEATIKWYELRKVVRVKKAIYVYTSPVRAFIFPMEQCGAQFEEICTTIKEKFKQYKNYVPEEEEPLGQFDDGGQDSTEKEKETDRQSGADTSDESLEEEETKTAKESANDTDKGDGG